MAERDRRSDRATMVELGARKYEPLENGERKKCLINQPLVVRGPQTVTFSCYLRVYDAHMTRQGLLVNNN